MMFREAGAGLSVDLTVVRIRHVDMAKLLRFFRVLPGSSAVQGSRRRM